MYIGFQNEIVLGKASLIMANNAISTKGYPNSWQPNPWVQKQWINASFGIPLLYSFFINEFKIVIH